MKKTLLALLFLTTMCKAQYVMDYINFDGDPMQLYSWEGEHVMLLSETPSLSPVTMQKWLDCVDNIYEFYQSCTGREPYCLEGKCFNGKGTVAWVEHTCGTACGILGTTGIEITPDFWQYFYDQLELYNKYDHVQFYEFGRNFWFYSDKLNYNGTEFGTVTGYAIFMRFMAMEALGYEGADFDMWLDFDLYKQGVVNMLSMYMADDDLNWYNTLAASQTLPNTTYSENDLLATFLLNLESTYGDCFHQNLWKYVGQRPDAQSLQDAVDNLVIACSQAAQTNLTQQFITWKWPVSDAAANFLANTVFENLDEPVAICTPANIVHPANNNDIGPRNISLADLQYTSGGYTADNYQHYIDHTIPTDALCPLLAPSAHLQQDNEYTLTVTTGASSETVKGWIDFNNNGTFEDAEIIISSTNAAVNYAHTATFTIPNNVTLNTSLRMRIASDFAGAPITQSCPQLQYGQTEDFAVIVNGTAGLDTPKESAFKIYPNPATTVLNFSETVNTAEIYGIDGKVVLKDKNCNHIDVSPLATGAYFIVTDNNVKQYFIKN